MTVEGAIEVLGAVQGVQVGAIVSQVLEKLGKSGKELSQPHVDFGHGNSGWCWTIWVLLPVNLYDMAVFPRDLLGGITVYGIAFALVGISGNNAYR